MHITLKRVIGAEYQIKVPLMSSVNIKQKEDKPFWMLKGRK